MAEKKKPGNFLEKKKQASTISLNDLENPSTFFGLFGDSDILVVIKWLQTHKLLVEDMTCSKCDVPCKLYKRKSVIDGYQFRCTANKNHEISVRRFSFFENSKIGLRDAMNFLRCYMGGANLNQCANQSGLHYTSTAVDWASFIREIMMNYVHNTASNMKLSGTIEIDESLFGKKQKYHRGKNTGNYFGNKNK